MALLKYKLCSLSGQGEKQKITESRRRMISPTKKADSKPAEAAPNAESSPIESTSENSIRCFDENVKKFRSCIFEGGEE